MAYLQFKSAQHNRQFRLTAKEKTMGMIKQRCIEYMYNNNCVDKVKGDGTSRLPRGRNNEITISFETFRNFCRDMKYDRNTLLEIKYILDELKVPKESLTIVPIRQKGISTVYQFCWRSNIIWEIDELDTKAVYWIEQL